MINNLNRDFLTGVYGFSEFTYEELLSQFYKKIEECINLSNESFEYLDWLKGEGLENEVNTQLSVWLEDGTLSNLINITQYNELKTELKNDINTLVTNHNIDIDTLSKNLNNRVEEIVTNQDNINQSLTKLVDDTNANLSISMNEMYNELNNSISETKNNLTTEINNTKELINNVIYINDSETVQEAINRAVTNNAILELKPDTYSFTTQLTIDLSKCSIRGNGAKFDFSGASTNLDCIKIIASNPTPYLQNGNFIENIEIIGKGSTSNQTAITFNSTSSNCATSHLNLKSLNIHDFKTGILYNSFAYLIRHYSVDVYACDTCVKMLNGLSDYGENINFYGCTFYNSNTGLLNENENGSFHLTSCSIDYMNDNFIISKNGARIFFVNGHIEGSAVIYGDVTFNNSWIILLNGENKLQGTNNQVINFTECFISTNVPNISLTNTEIVINFNRCRHLTVSNFSTCTLNDNSSINHTKTLKYFPGENVTIEKDSSIKESGNFSYKISKSSGSGSNGNFRVLIKRKNIENTRYNIVFRNISTVQFSNLDITYCPTDIISYGDSPTFQDGETIGHYKLTTIGNWSNFNIINNTSPIISNAEYIAVDFNLFNMDGTSGNIYIDKLFVFEY